MGVGWGREGWDGVKLWLQSVASSGKHRMMKIQNWVGNVMATVNDQVNREINRDPNQQIRLQTLFVAIFSIPTTLIMIAALTSGSFNVCKYPGDVAAINEPVLPNDLCARSSALLVDVNNF